MQTSVPRLNTPLILRSAHKVGLFVSRRATLVAISVCSLLEILVTIVRLGASAGRAGAIPLDSSWLIGLASTLQHGQISGRDFQFTYGLFGQLLAQLGATLNTRGSVIDGQPLMILSFITAGIVVLALALSLIRHLDWKHIVSIYAALTLLNIPINGNVVRPMLVVLCAVLLYRTMSASTSRTQLLLAVATGAECVVSQLVTVETGLFAFIPAVAALGVFAFVTHVSKIMGPREDDNREGIQPAGRYLMMLAVVVSTFVVGNILISALFMMTSPNYRSLFDYQRHAFEIVGAYNYTQGTTWSLPILYSLGFLVLAAYVVGYAVRSVRKQATTDSYLFAILAIFALVYTKGAITRSDLGHILQALTPLVLLFLLIGTRLRLTRVLRPDGLAWIMLLAALITIWPNTSVSAFQQIGDIAIGRVSWPQKLQQVLALDTPPGAMTPTGMAQALSDPTRPMLNFPYDNYISADLGRKPVAPVLQSYAAGTVALQHYYVDALKKTAGSLDVVYGLDGFATWAVDDVQAITRVPIIFDYLYRNFELMSQRRYGAGYYILRQRRRPVTLAGVGIHGTVTRTATSNISFTPTQPAICSLVRLTVEVHYSVASVLGRPDAFHLAFFNKGKEVEHSDMVTLETGKAFTTYVSLIDANRFYQVFGHGHIQTKSWDKLQISPRATGLFEVLPSRVSLIGVGCIDLHNGSQTTNEGPHS